VSDPHTSSQSQGSRRGYLVGFALSVVLTAIPFWLVMTGVLASVSATAITIFALAAVQIVVHVAFFLHLDTRSEGGWTLLAFAFTLVIVVITIGGSIWVMYHLNTNMMPGMGPS
jgi:cytochrome o ubiquinol oxidase operon protein cyoD